MDFGSHSLALEGGGVGLLLLIAAKRLTKAMSGSMKDELAVHTAPMANAYANALVLDKIENLVATLFRGNSAKRARGFSI